MGAAVPVPFSSAMVTGGDLVVPDGAQLCLIHDLGALDTPLNFSLRVGAGACVAYRFVGGGGAAAQLNGRSINAHIRLAGPRAEADVAGAMVMGAADVLDFNMTISHDAPGAKSVQNVYAVVGGRAAVSYRGMVHVAPSAQQSDARQMCRSVLLSRRARMVTRPELEIYADDVAATHGATCGALDPQVLFYLTSRGIPHAAARILMLTGFLSAVTEDLSPDAQAQVLSHLEAVLREGDMDQ